MTNFLIKFFIKDYNNTSNIYVREQYGKLSGIVGICVNLLLFAGKILAGLFFSSIAMTADAFNNLSDSASSIVTLIGFKLSNKPADEKHPYGHARIEYIAGMIISFIIMIVGFQLFLNSFQKIIHPEEFVFSYASVFVAAFAILAKVWLGLFYRKTGKKINSTAISASAADSINDVYATSAVLVSMLIGKLTGFNLDGYAGIAVAVFILISGYGLVMETLNPLLGLAPDGELVEQIENKIKSYDGVLGLHDLVVHNYGPERCFASVHVEVSAKADILISHDMIDNIEKDFLNDMNIHLVIHLDPIITDDENVNQIKDFVNEIILKIDNRITMHDFRVVFGASHSNIIFDIVLPPDFTMSDKEITGIISDKVKEYNDNYFSVITVDRNYLTSKKKSKE